MVTKERRGFRYRRAKNMLVRNDISLGDVLGHGVNIRPEALILF